MQSQKVNFSPRTLIFSKTIPNFIPAQFFLWRYALCSMPACPFVNISPSSPISLPEGEIWTSASVVSQKYYQKYFSAQWRAIHSSYPRTILCNISKMSLISDRHAGLDPASSCITI
jgi:hypothetical protein